jgi:hypothetical protein
MSLHKELIFRLLSVQYGTFVRQTVFGKEAASNMNTNSESLLKFWFTK